MNDAVRHTSVLIVGAGPSGLMMAAQLLRLGIHPSIIDAGNGPSNQSRAIAVHARSMEIYRQLGLEKEAIQAGTIVDKIILHQGIKEQAQIDLASIGTGDSLFPYVLMLDQGKNERLLLNYLTENTCPVYWNSTLLELRQDEKFVHARINRNGTEEHWTADWLIGADGASSTVRKLLRVPFRGGSYNYQFYLADIGVNQNLGDQIRFFHEESGFLGCFPIKPGSVYRFIGVLPKSLRNTPDLNFEDLKPFLTFSLDFSLQIEKCLWFSTYTLHHRMADHFNQQRCFLIGDAAHIHSPIGGQGMNTGLQDAYNLAWKLAGVVRGTFHATLLNTYSEERMPVARNLLKTTDRLFNLLVSENPLLKILRKLMMATVVKRAWSRENKRLKVFQKISQTGINYRNNSLSVHYSQLKSIKAGDRLPYAVIYDEKKDEGTDLHAWCSKPGFTLLVIGNLKERDVFTLAKWIKLTYPHDLNFYYLPPSARNQHIFDRFEVSARQNKAIIIRPDMHIGYINDIVDIDMIDLYLKKIVGWKALA